MMEKVILGKAGVKISPLVLGTGTFNGAKLRTLGRDKFVELVNHAFDVGITAVDTSEAYPEMHSYLREALRGKSDVFIIAKISDYGAPMIEKVNSIRKEIGFAQLGCVLLHCLCDEGWPIKMRRQMDELNEMKARGAIISVGISAHNLPTVRSVATTNWVDVALFRLNRHGIRVDGPNGDGCPDGSPVEPCLQAMRQVKASNPCGMLAMKVLCEGRLQTKEARLDSFRWVANTGLFHAYVAGLTSPTEVDELVEHYQLIKGT